MCLAASLAEMCACYVFNAGAGLTLEGSIWPSPGEQYHWTYLSADGRSWGRWLSYVDGWLSALGCE
jgi:hypothetical protein